MLKAYVDDSVGSTGGRPLYLAAYVLTADQWIEFSDAWAEALAEPPAIAYFKMAEANGRGGCFRKFSVKERNKKVFRMAQVVRQFAPHGMHAVVSTVQFNQILKPHVPHALKTPYFEACYLIIYGLARMHEDLQLKMKCDVIFDNHSGLPGKVIPIFDMLAIGPESWREWIGGTPVFADDKDVLPLQAADLLAWHLRREGEGVKAPDYPNILDMLVVDGAHYVLEMDRATLEDLAEKFRTHPTMHMIQDKKDWDDSLRLSLDLFHEAQRQRGAPFSSTAEAEEESLRLIGMKKLD